MIDRSEIRDVARTYLGVRWRHRGRSRTGLDCIGLLVAVGRDLGLSVEDTDREYRKTPDIKLFLDMIRRQTVEGSMNYIRTGSILMLRQGVYPCHCGFAVFDPGVTPSFIHAATLKRSVVEEPLAQHMANVIEVREMMGVL